MRQVGGPAGARWFRAGGGSLRAPSGVLLGVLSLAAAVCWVAVPRAGRLLAQDRPAASQQEEASKRAVAPGGAGTSSGAMGGAGPRSGTSMRHLSTRRPERVPWWQRGLSLVGLFGLVGLAWLVSERRDRFPWRLVLWGLGLQFLFALFVLRTPVGLALFEGVNDVVGRLLQFAEEGARFVFGEYFDARFSIALRVLPTIVFFSSLMAVLYHLGVMQRVVGALAWAMHRTMRTSGSETLSAAANVFVGQTEAPLVVRPYLEGMTRSELNAVMVGGFATVAGGVLAAYVQMLRDFFPDIAGHLVAASVLSAPAALVVAKVLVPETEPSPTAAGATLRVERLDANLLGAAARGAGEGLMLALNVGAMLVAFVALVAVANFLLSAPSAWLFARLGVAAEPLTLQRMLGWACWPLALLMGVAPEDCSVVGALLGEKVVLNEFVAYGSLAEGLRAGTFALHPRSIVVASYALCGFANFGSIAIQVGGIGSIVPERRNDLARLGLRAMFGGVLAACMTGAVAGLLW